MIALAEAYPINNTDPISFEIIPHKNKVVISTGFQFDIEILIDWFMSQAKGKHLNRLQTFFDNGDCENPLTRQKFSPEDTAHVWRIASRKIKNINNDLLPVAAGEEDAGPRERRMGHVFFNRDGRGRPDYPHSITVLADLGLVDREIFAHNIPNVFMTETALQNIREGRVRILTLKEYGYLTMPRRPGANCIGTGGLLNAERSTDRIDNLVARGLLDAETRGNLNQDELNTLHCENIVNLILEAKITVDEARRLLTQEVINLNADGVYQLIHDGQLTVERAKGLSTDEVIQLNAGGDVNAVLGRGGPPV